MAADESGVPGRHVPHPHHTADPAALEDPVHHDVAAHELDEEAAADEDDGTSEEPEASAGEAGDPPDQAPWPEPAEATGDERVDAAAQRLQAVSGTPASEHVAVYEDVHRRLQDSLAELDGS